MGRPARQERMNITRNPKLTASLPAPGPSGRRGYFAVGAERSSKALNLGNLMRSAHGFGASFTFTVGATYQALEARADTSKGQWHLPHHNWPTLDEMALPQGCKLVGVELLEEAIDLPSFAHPLRAAYVLGPEQGSLTPALLSRCDYVVRIPTSFCVNVAMAGAIVMYDRVRSLGSFAERPLSAAAQKANAAPRARSGGKPDRQG
jgi:tRNA G18 (ribose-2'-O)-methylase SpoU